MCLFEQVLEQGAARFQSITVWCVTDCVLCDCSPRCLQVIDTLLLCNFGLIYHLSHDRPCSRPRVIDGHSVCLPFLNNCTSNFHLLTMLLPEGLFLAGLVLVPFGSSLVLPYTHNDLISRDCNWLIDWLCAHVEHRLQAVLTFKEHPVTLLWETLCFCRKVWIILLLYCEAHAVSLHFNHILILLSKKY